MTLRPEDWPRVKELFERARACAVRVARRFLEETCAGNEALYREVDSLLASSEQVSDLPNQCVAAKSL